jgi:peroxiredoxin
MHTLKRIVFLIITLCWAATTIARPIIDKPAPAFSAKSISGKTVSLSEFRGKTVVLEWTNHQCPFVQKHYNSDNMQTLQRKYTKDGVVWLTLISSAPGKQGYVSADKAKQLTTDRKAAPSDILLDSDGVVGKLYGAKTTPHMYIIDGEGILRYMGGIDSIRSTDQADIKRADNYVKNGLDELMAGKAIAQTVSSPYGCSIKY